MLHFAEENPSIVAEIIVKASSEKGWHCTKIGLFDIGEDICFALTVTHREGHVEPVFFFPTYTNTHIHSHAYSL